MSCPLIITNPVKQFYELGREGGKVEAVEGLLLTSRVMCLEGGVPSAESPVSGNSARISYQGQ